MKLEVGMYVRIKWGNGLQTISQCKNIVDMGDTQYAKEDFYIHTDHSGEVIYKTMIVKSSFNIIDLVECGDYVNGSEVLDFENKYIEEDDKFVPIGVITENCYLENTDSWIIEKNIKSVITHEQIEQMEYRLGDDE